MLCDPPLTVRLTARVPLTPELERANTANPQP